MKNHVSRFSDKILFELSRKFSGDQSREEKLQIDLWTVFFLGFVTCFGFFCVLIAQALLDGMVDLVVVSIFLFIVVFETIVFFKLKRDFQDSGQP